MHHSCMSVLTLHNHRSLCNSQYNKLHNDRKNHKCRCCHTHRRFKKRSQIRRYHLTPAAPAAALVEDEPSSSTAKRHKVQVDPIVRDWFISVSQQWRTERQWDMCEVRRLCPAMFDAIDQNTPYRWKWSAPRAAPPRGRLCCHPRLSERIMRVIHVLCLSAVTIRDLVHKWLDEEGNDLRPSKT